MKQCIRNVVTVLENDPKFKGAIRYNMMTDRNDIVKGLGWYRESPALTDSDIDHILLYLEESALEISLFLPESMEKIDERYVEAVQNREKVEFQLDTLLWGTEDEKEAVIHDLGKGVEDIERRVREYRRNQGTVNHNRQRSCEAVH